MIRFRGPRQQSAPIPFKFVRVFTIVRLFFRSRTMLRPLAWKHMIRKILRDAYTADQSLEDSQKKRNKAKKHQLCKHLKALL